MEQNKNQLPETEEIIYTVHSDVDENNIMREFDDKEAAIKYAKENAVDETWVEKLVLFYDDNDYLIDESTPEVIWAYDDAESDEE